MTLPLGTDSSCEHISLRVPSLPNHHPKHHAQFNIQTSTSQHAEQCKYSFHPKTKYRISISTLLTSQALLIEAFHQNDYSRRNNRQHDSLLQSGKIQPLLQTNWWHLASSTFGTTMLIDSTGVSSSGCWDDVIHASHRTSSLCVEVEGKRSELS